jgi:hypothetical protein
VQFDKYRNFTVKKRTKPASSISLPLLDNVSLIFIKNETHMKINGKAPLSNNGSEMDDAGFVLFFTVKFLYLSNCTHLSNVLCSIL